MRVGIVEGLLCRDGGLTRHYLRLARDVMSSIPPLPQPRTPGRPRCQSHGLLLDDQGGCARCAAEVLKVHERRFLRATCAAAAVVVAVLGGTILLRTANASAVCTPRASSEAVSIVVFGANWCGSCRAAKAWLEKEGYDYEWHDVDDAATGRLLRTQAKVSPGRIAIPVIGVDGDYSQGFNPGTLQRRIEEARERCKTTPTQ